jgi:hypothetical protein
MNTRNAVLCLPATIPPYWSCLPNPPPWGSRSNRRKIYGKLEVFVN